jgi:SAM-dependent methyltransferase
VVDGNSNAWDLKRKGITMNMTTTVRPPAEIYDEKFVPALFGPWGPVVSDAASVAPGEAVLDVACGTGALTLAALAIVGPDGRVAGLDANPEMLAVARRKTGDIDWREGVAENLPFENASFDAVISQFGFMFFDDRPRALSEMMRVLRPGGRLAVAVCGAVERSPGYAAFAKLLDRLFGVEVGNAFRAPFVLGDAGELSGIAAAAGIEGASVQEHNGTVRFKSIAELVATERACVWTLGGILDQDQFDRLLRESEQALRSFADSDGMVSFDMPALILTARKMA